MCCALGTYRAGILPGYGEKARADPSVALISTLWLERPIRNWDSSSALQKAPSEEGKRASAGGCTESLCFTVSLELFMEREDSIQCRYQSANALRVKISKKRSRARDYDLRILAHWVARLYCIQLDSCSVYFPLGSPHFPKVGDFPSFASFLPFPRKSMVISRRERLSLHQLL